MKAGMMLTTGRQMTVGPALQRSLKLLQMNSLDFVRELNSFAESNPMIEIDEHETEQQEEPLADIAASGFDDRDDEFASSAEPGAEAADYETHVAFEAPAGARDSQAWGITGRSQSGGPASGDPVDWIATVAAKTGLREHLGTQLTDAKLSPDLATVAFAILDSLDDRGYLEDSPEELGRLWRDQGIPASDALIGQALNVVQSLEPAGVGATGLAECLLIQLNRREDKHEAAPIARAIVKSHLSLLAQGNTRSIGRETGEPLARVRAAIELIKSLDPSPGRQFDNQRVDYVAPELSVRKVDGQWTALPVSGFLPRVRINKLYADILGKQKLASRNQPLNEKLQEARWLIKNLEQREQTILAVGQAIVARQPGYFDHGEIALRPMTLSDIASDIEMHESTVSRVVSTKYMVCPGGLKPLKGFFTSSVKTNAGQSCSASAVKAMIQSLIDEEPDDQPLSDHKLADQLRRKGVRVARRTVSKYRQAMGIRSFELRREGSA